MPPTGAVVVGAGGGAWLKSLSSLSVEYVDCIEADEKQAHYLRPLLEEHPGWRLHQALVWSEARELTYHIASNPTESGVIEPETLATIWPNLTTRSREPRQAVALRHLLDGIPAERQPSWLIIDCLPAQPILQGLGEQLENYDVIVARCLADSTNSSEIRDGNQAVHHTPTPNTCISSEDPTFSAKSPFPEAPLSGLLWQELKRMLVLKGYRHLISEPERHPNMLNTLYIRDWQTKDVAMQLGSCSQLAERKEHLDEVFQEIQKLRNINTDFSDRNRLYTEEITKAEAQIEEYKQSKIYLEKQKAELEVQLKKSAKLADDRLNNINELNRTINSYQAKETYQVERQQLIKKEMTCAEAQLDLIKEILSGESMK